MLSKERRQVMQLFYEGGELDAPAVAKVYRNYKGMIVSTASVSKMLSAFCRQGLLDRVKYGIYQISTRGKSAVEADRTFSMRWPGVER